MGRINSRAKGARAEREWRDELRAQGYTARRGQQYCGNPDAPDVVCEEMQQFHTEVKRVEALRLRDAVAQAEGDCGGKPWLIAHKYNHGPWLVMMKSDTFFALLRGDYEITVQNREVKCSTNDGSMKKLDAAG